MDNSQMKILIVDDERTNLEILSRILRPKSMKSNYTLCTAKSGQAALRKSIEEKPDLILLDIIMPDMNGFEILSVLKDSVTTRNIPVIFITAMDSVEDEEKGLLLGAVDYITKPFHSSLVRARVETHLRIVEQMRTIEMLGLIDSLTGIPNRRGFDNQITTEWGRAIREGKSLNLLMGDIDNFKIFNDTHGHQQGDAVLKAVAGAIKTSLKRPSDFVARWGGEEFAIILPDIDKEGAIQVAENVRTNVEKVMIPSIHGTYHLNVTISIGVASATPDISSIVQQLVSQADKALYYAKRNGRNKVCHKT